MIVPIASIRGGTGKAMVRGQLDKSYGNIKDGVAEVLKFVWNPT